MFILGDVTYRANRRELSAVANSAEVQAVILRGAQSVAQKASGKSKKSYIVDVRPGQFRAHARATTLPTEGAFFTEWRTQALRHSKPKI